MKHTDILIKLAYLKPKECIHKHFNFNTFNSDNRIIDSRIPNCGTAGCLAGELPGLTEDWYFTSDGRLRCKLFDKHYTFESLWKYFGIDSDIIKHLFHPTKLEYQYMDPATLHPLLNGITFLDTDATLEEVQANLKIFLTNSNIVHGENKAI